MKEFNALNYTRDSLAEEWGLVERHARDGSAVNAGCACIEEKHLLTIAGLSSEGVTLAKDTKEKEFYMQLANLAREIRKNIVYSDWKLPGLKQSSCDTKILTCIKKGKTYGECRASVKCIS